jgi:hypothetical protein
MVHSTALARRRRRVKIKHPSPGLGPVSLSTRSRSRVSISYININSCQWCTVTYLHFHLYLHRLPIRLVYRTALAGDEVWMEINHPVSARSRVSISYTNINRDRWRTYLRFRFHLCLHRFPIRLVPMILQMIVNL